MPRLLDLLIIFILSIIIIPVFLILIIIAYIFHRNTIFFIQERLGRNKEVFKLIKFRSMIINAQNMGTGLYSYSDDFRITFFGRFLRYTSLDELPQILNILKGDMSFIGPRPAVVGELEQEIDLPLNFELRFTIRPGLTGWAQIHGRDNLSWNQKVNYDLEFVNSKGLNKFAKIVYILLYTPFYLFNFNATYEKRK